MSGSTLCSHPSKYWIEMSDLLPSCQLCFIPGKRGALYPLNRRVCGPGAIWEIFEKVIIIIIIIISRPCRESIHERYRGRTFITWSFIVMTKLANDWWLVTSLAQGDWWLVTCLFVCFVNCSWFFKLFGAAIRIYFCNCFEKDKTGVEGVAVTKDVLRFPCVFFVLRNVCQCHEHIVIYAVYTGGDTCRSPCDARCAGKNTCRSPCDARYAGGDTCRSPCDVRCADKNMCRSPCDARCAGRNTCRSPWDARCAGKNTRRSP
jgi:hypothetical protein